MMSIWSLCLLAVSILVARMALGEMLYLGGLNAELLVVKFGVLTGSRKRSC